MAIDDGLFNALAEPACRQFAATQLALALGCEELLLFVVDRDTGVFVPAPGMHKTLHGGPHWREFLQKCARSGSYQCDVDLPASTVRPARCVSTGASVAVAVGGKPHSEGWDALRRRMPLIGALLMSEQNVRLQQSQAAMAQEGAARALSLAKALDAARAAAGELNKKLQEEHRRKDEFLAMLAHELRNPLAPLVNSVAILRHIGQAGPSGLPRILDIMERQISQLSRLVNDLLDVSRVSRGAITLQHETLALADVLQAAIETVTPLLDAKRHQLTTHGLPHETLLFGDRTRLIQVFSNLLQNAAKYTPAGGAIDIELVRDAGRVSVMIKDNGVGIPADMQAPVFELFTQAHAAIDRAEGGLGIGLTLARTLVKLHGGELSVYSAGLGAGSVFTVHLPLADTPMSDATPESEPRTISPGPPARVVRVLIVEDNPDVSATIAELLQHMQAQVRVTQDGEQALTTAKEFNPELVLLDIGLPGMSGYEVASRMRTEIGGHLRLIALTGYGSPADRERARRAGFDDHLVKPASPETLQRILRQISEHA